MVVFPSFFKALWYSIVGVYYLFSVHSPINRHLGCFPFLTIVINIVMNMLWTYLLEILFLTLLDIYSEVELPNCRIYGNSIINCLRSLPPVFSVMTSALTFKSWIHFWLIFMNDIRGKVQFHSFKCSYPVFPAQFFEETVFCPLSLLDSLYSISVFPCLFFLGCFDNWFNFLIHF